MVTSQHIYNDLSSHKYITEKSRVVKIFGELVQPRSNTILNRSAYTRLRKSDFRQSTLNLLLNNSFNHSTFNCAYSRKITIVRSAQDFDSKTSNQGPFSWFKNAAEKLNELAEDTPLPPALVFATSLPAPLWDLQVSLFERSPSDGPLNSKASSKLPLVDLSLTCSFQPPDQGAYPPRGGADVEDSRFFKGGPGAFWISDEMNETFFKFTLNSETVRAGQIEIIPEGRVYFNARLEESKSSTSSFEMLDGVVTVKQDVKASFLGQDYSGILAEFIVIGTFVARPKSPN
eukprot:CAMPEP_0196587774 /NCGR_PEP_ID=MMETSP1081-20130531/58556_1 /TAXON_ID=36882 /ORGANISM="Pyramimonas amylifera, Strain CCMP720" /LENGTH=287 /DNA_ID=CAMNT_0041910053 /DNA_START=83 /DNA_END=946 /DNA_ORIENTATION=+